MTNTSTKPHLEHIDDEKTMRHALKAARRAGLAGEPPIGAALIRDDQIISIASNTIISSVDITAHAEINVIRHTCSKERTIDLSGCKLYTTVEPCPMCYAASHYVGISHIVFGASREDLHAVTGSEMQSGPRPEATGGGPIVSGGCLHSESKSLLNDWHERRNKSNSK